MPTQRIYLRLLSPLVSRFLYAKRKILHRDISKGNILRLKDGTKACSPSPLGIPPTQTDQGTVQTPSTAVIADPSEEQERKPSFIKFLLNKRCVGLVIPSTLPVDMGHEYSDDPQETSALLIDFNRSENVKGKERTAEFAADRTVGVHSLSYQDAFTENVY